MKHKFLILFILLIIILLYFGPSITIYQCYDSEVNIRDISETNIGLSDIKIINNYSEYTSFLKDNIDFHNAFDSSTIDINFFDNNSLIIFNHILSYNVDDITMKQSTSNNKVSLTFIMKSHSFRRRHIRKNNRRIKSYSD